MGPEATTPIPVPALTTVWTRLATPPVIRCAMAVARGGEAKPVLAPAIRMPAARTGPDCATATTAMPAVATTPAATATRRAPTRSVMTRAMVIAAQ